jgi:hypothetical protein
LAHAPFEAGTRYDAAVVRAAVDRLRQVPDAHRRFAQPEPGLARQYGIGPALLAQLLDCGLPHRGSGTGRRYDGMDLENLGLALALGPRWRAMRWWSDSLSKLDIGDDAEYRIGLAARCPEPGHDGPCTFALAPQLRAAAGPSAVREVTPGSYAFDLRIAGGHRFFGEPFTPLVEAATALRFHLLPTSLADDLGFLAATGLADCRLASRHLVGLGERFGMGVRVREGMFLAVPYPVWHSWVEFHTGDGWFAADPFLLGAFRRWNITDPDQWPPNRSPHAMLWPLPETHFVKVTHGSSGAAERPAPSRLTVVQRGHSGSSPRR